MCETKVWTTTLQTLAKQAKSKSHFEIFKNDFLAWWSYDLAKYDYTFCIYPQDIYCRSVKSFHLFKIVVWMLFAKLLLLSLSGISLLLQIMQYVLTVMEIIDFVLSVHKTFIRNFDFIGVEEDHRNVALRWASHHHAWCCSVNNFVFTVFSLSSLSNLHNVFQKTLFKERA